MPRISATVSSLAGLALLLVACDAARSTPPDATDRCQQCHGGAAGNAAPPRSLGGATDRTARGVGAHQAHVQGTAVRGPLDCSECHPMPDAQHPMAHPDGRLEVAFGALGQGGGSPAWSVNQLTCTATYCHGGSLGAGGTLTVPTWTAVDGAASACGACHGNPPTAVAGRRHPASTACHTCHPATVRPDGTIDVEGGHHVNGVPEIQAGCDACHGAPPSTGAHLAHARPPRLTGMTYGEVTVLEDVALPGDDPGPYAFGCGQCHPTDPARHMNGDLEIELSPAGAPAGSLKSRNHVNARWDFAGGICGGVACHSSGQATPAFAAVPSWYSGGPLDCSACHGNPPRYPSGGPGAPDANGHLQLQEDGYEWGHFAGLPGPWHTSYHGWSPGSLDSAPITCQACHAGTVDPAATAPGGFFWLNTTGDYQLPTGLLGYRCGACHGAPGGPPTGAGRVLGLRHVNGQRDVEFDARTDLPAQPWLPAPPNRPTRPYWVTTSTFPTVPPPGAVLEGNTLSMNLGAAGWAPATKTCSSVACHLDQATVVWGAPHEGYNACSTCHPY